MKEVMKCYACGHTKDRGSEYKEVITYHKYGKKKGLEKSRTKEYVQNDPDTKDFIQIHSLLIGENGIIQYGINYSPYSGIKEISLFSCPICGTIKMEKYEE